ncbi:MAG: glycosyltransferase family 2 protein [Acidimicrobiales bacterium]
MGEHRRDADAPGRRPDRVLVIVPAYQEEEALPGVLKELAEEVPGYDVLVVDDGSRDATSEVARAAGVPVAPLPFNLGVGGALRVGFLYALRHGYDRAAQFDGDCQHDGTEIPRLLAALDAGVDLVIGSRFAAGGADDASEAGDAGPDDYPVGRTRRAAMRLLERIVLLLSGQRLTDTSSGFRGFSASLIEYFALNYPVEYLGDTVEALLLAHYAGFEIAEVRVAMRHRVGGTPSTRNLRLAYHYCRLIVVLGASASRPRARGRSR